MPTSAKCMNKHSQSSVNTNEGTIKLTIHTTTRGLITLPLQKIFLASKNEENIIDFNKKKTYPRELPS
uniref:Uncharacterized protein n=1 Tax=Ciona intestinalis TaxID=7719 RepID=H2Y2H7_CIOIN